MRKFIKFSTYLFICTISLSINAQNYSLIIRDNAAINIENGAIFIIDQSNASGIVRTGSANGVIISENETDRLAWVISNGTGTYNIPFGKDLSKQIPLIYTVTTAGSASGTLIASTYSSSWDNIPMPSIYAPAVTTMTMEYPPSDLSAYVVDRFYILRDNGTWTSKPASNLSLSYDNIEYTAASNTITESNLLAQYWNTNQWSPGWNSGSSPLGTNDAANNRVFNINSEANGNLYSWILVDRTMPLPVSLIDFHITCNDGEQVEISWATESEINNDKFIIEKSSDAILWEFLTSISGAGNSNSSLIYTYFENELPSSTQYYRLSQQDFNGLITILSIQEINCSSFNNNQEYSFNVYSDLENQIYISFSSKEEQDIICEVYGFRGRLLQTNRFFSETGDNTFKLIFSPLSNATYFIRLSGQGINYSKKIFLQ